MFVATLLLAPASMPVAYTARVYYPAGDKRSSHYQVYLSTLDGKSKRQITFTDQDCSAVSWQSANALVWVQQKGASLLVRYDLKTKKLTILAKNDSIYREFFTPGTKARGRAIYHIGNKAMEVTGTTLKPYKGQLWNDEIAALTINAPSQIHPGSLAYDPKTKVATLSMGGRSRELANQTIGETFLDAYIAPDKQTYAVTLTGNSTFGHPLLIRRIDWSTSQIFTVATGVDIDFRPGSPWLAYVTERDLLPLGNGSVWTSRAYIKNNKSSNSVLLVPKMADVLNIALSPSLP